MGDRGVVGDAANGLVVRHDRVLDVAHVLGHGRVAGCAAHGREDVGVGVDDHGGSLCDPKLCCVALLTLDWTLWIPAFAGMTV